jgi:hypothetical protein
MPVGVKEAGVTTFGPTPPRRRITRAQFRIQAAGLRRSLPEESARANSIAHDEASGACAPEAFSPLIA